MDSTVLRGHRAMSLLVLRFGGRQMQRDTVDAPVSLPQSMERTPGGQRLH